MCLNRSFAAMIEPSQGNDLGPEGIPMTDVKPAVAYSRSE